MQKSGIEGEHLILLLEDHQLLEPTYLELINSLLSSGEIPGLFTAEELEPLLSPLKDLAADKGFLGPLHSFFSSRVQQYLHIVLIMDSSSTLFTLYCEANPALYTSCTFLSMEGWSQRSMLQLPRAFLNKDQRSKIILNAASRDSSKTEEDLSEYFLKIHQTCPSSNATPRRYISFLDSYQSVYFSKKDGLLQKQKRLQAGVGKLNEAANLVAELKQKAATQRTLLSQKQVEADEALQEITISMQTASEQRNEVEIVKGQQNEERAKLEKRKKAIDIELSEIEPLIQEARRAVGNIKPETLSEIRALRMPPAVIRDILEGVLRIMGIFDTSWGSMRSFLARREVKEDIQGFDARKITADIRENVQEHLDKAKNSFEPQAAKRASQAAAPLAAWVKANVRFSFVLEKIGPLEREQAGLQQNLAKSEKKLVKLGHALESLDRKVAEMRARFEQCTTEAAKLRLEVEKQEETIAAAENLVGKLEGEHKRWADQVNHLNNEVQQLPKQALLAAAAITYLSQAPEDERKDKMSQWVSLVGLQDEGFELRGFLSSESDQLVWKAEGLPSDDLSVENALVILQGGACPLLVDPSQRATEWLKTHMKDKRLEVINQQDSNFTTALELAVRFGKTLVIQEVDGVEPLLVPLLRKDLANQGSRYVVQIGDKSVDYNDSFVLYLTTRSPQLEIPPDTASIINLVNFTTTRAGLTSQLLAASIQHEKPELEQRKSELLKSEEELKVQLNGLEESLLQELASAEGNILENKTLLDSLNLTKQKSSTIQQSLEESVHLQKSLNQERDTYLPLAQYGSKLFFVISSLRKLNHMYQISLGAFLRLFHRALESREDIGSTELRIRALSSTLQSLVYGFVCRSLFKSDCLMFAMHLVHGIHPSLFQEKEWEAFTGQLVTGMFRRQESMVQMKESLPAWCDPEQVTPVVQLKTNFPVLFNNLELHSESLWAQFSRSSQCERDFPQTVSKKITLFQQLLVIQALRPDRLQTAMSIFAAKSLGLKELSPTTLNLRRLYSTETLPNEPTLIIISPGADPSQEIQEVADEVVGEGCYHQVAMGQGQADKALLLLHECANDGHWLCLKNLHLVTAWLPVLEKELNALEPHRNFRLWLTTEAHPRFPPILLQSSLKVTYESPPGVKRNLQRTYDTWTEDYIGEGSNTKRAQTLFCLAWLHAIVQERRCYIPQGWSQFYEFSMADLRVGANLIDRLSSRGSELYHDHSNVLHIFIYRYSMGVCTWSNGDCNIWRPSGQLV